MRILLLTNLEFGHFEFYLSFSGLFFFGGWGRVVGQNIVSLSFMSKAMHACTNISSCFLMRAQSHFSKSLCKKPLLQDPCRFIYNIPGWDPRFVLSVTPSKGKIKSAMVFPDGNKIYLCNLTFFPCLFTSTRDFFLMNWEKKCSFYLYF